MTIPTPEVRIGLDIADESFGPFFTLGDATRGVLGNTEWVLAGSILFDVTDRVRNISVNRGRSRDFADYPAGQVTVTMNNFDRAFDPLYTSSPFFGSVVPRRELRVSSNGIELFRGWISDWNLFYSKDGESLVDAVGIDATSILTKQTIGEEIVPTEESTGTRINSILDRADVNWSASLRDIDTGNATLGTQTIANGTNALTYMQKVAETEPGALFVDRTGKVKFVERNTGYSSTDIVTFGQAGTAIPFDNLQVIYGSELLYNEVHASREGGGTAIASNIDSQDAYGIRQLEISGLLFSNDEQLLNLAVNYAIQYSEPEYRFEGFEVRLHKLSATDQNKVLALDMGDAVQISFTPNGIAPAIERFLEVIRINHVIEPDEHIVQLGFRSIDYPPFVLGDSLFGKLGTGVLAW